MGRDSKPRRRRWSTKDKKEEEKTINKKRKKMEGNRIKAGHWVTFFWGVCVVHRLALVLCLQEEAKKLAEAQREEERKRVAAEKAKAFAAVRARLFAREELGFIEEPSEAIFFFVFWGFVCTWGENMTAEHFHYYNYHHCECHHQLLLLLFSAATGQGAGAT